MKINKLTFQAIGPFPGHHTINFDLLGDAALFLIDGPTGAGKSTIIDAITFGIYGDTAGTDSDKSRMRSQHAPADRKSFVELTFTTGAGTFKVFRSPEFMRSRTRGEGLTKENAKASLVQVLPDGEERGVAEHVQEVGNQLLEIVGLTKDQFAQTVVLPQGEFAKFLKADSKEREPLLQKIFSTDFYSEVMRGLEDRSRTASQAVESESEKITALLNQIQGVLQLEEEQFNLLMTLSAQPDADEELTSNLNLILKHLTDEKARLAKELEIAKKEFDSSREIFESRKKEFDAQSRLLRATSELEKADGANQASLDSVLAIDSRVLTEVDLKASDVDFDFNWSELSTTLASTITSLIPAKTAEVELETNTNKVAQDRIDLEKIALEIVDLEERIKTTLPKQIAECRNTQSKLQGAANKKATAEKALSDIQEKLETHKELEKLRDVLLPIEKLFEEQAEASKAAENARKSLVEARYADMAGELAENLQSGEACAVCGATEHPKKAKRKGTPVTEEDIQAAENHAGTERAKLDELNQKITSLKTNISSLEKGTKEDASELNSKLEVASTDLENIIEAEKQIESVQSEIEELEKALMKSNDDLGTRKAEKGNLDASLKSLKSTLENNKKLISDSIGEFSSVEERISNLQELADLMSGLIQAKQSRAELSGEVNLAKIAFDEMSKTEDFADFTSAESVMNDKEGFYLGKKSESDSIAASLADATELKLAVLSALEKRQSAAQGTLAIAKLAKLAKGENQYRQTLQTYVLQTMFEDVVSAANTRFRTLLEGRYELRTSGEVTDGRTKQGLNLNVYDTILQSTRKASTLSGGESFCASLALALGLADIVQSNSGGIEIDTLFVDEGFGSLDGERLDDVMNMLTHLRQEGRTVGVISHVDEMKTQILERIVVTPDKENGPSTLKVNWDQTKD